MNHDKTQVATLLADYERALNASDTDAVLRLYAPDGVFMPQHSPSSVGATAVRAAYDAVFGAIRLNVTFDVAEIRHTGDQWAFARTNSAGTVTVLASGATSAEANQELFVLQKLDGAWKDRALLLLDHEPGTMNDATMKAAVVHTAGGPEVLVIEHRPVPRAVPGRVLIRVKAAGVNRSEMFTRQGHSPGVAFPRILGIEATGTVEDAPGGEFMRGDTVITAMGGLGRDFDGGYAEYTLVPTANVRRIVTNVPSETLGALPEMLQTAWGSLFTSLRLQRGERLLIRGGTTSIGLAATAIAKRHGALVSATTRDPQRATILRDNGVDEVFIDTGSIAADVRAAQSDGVDKVLELIGTTTLIDSLACAKVGGIVCMTGIAGNAWTFDSFSPMDDIPTGVSLTSYAGELSNFMETPFQELVDAVADKTLRIAPAKVFRLDEIVEAHWMMEDNRAGGKIVIVP